jgi:tetratricopeptide (TPR) repeat protein
MEPAIDPFQPLLRILDRYRQDVHALRPPASEETLRQTTTTLGLELPETLVAFLLRWNGANLFRGALKIRSCAELATVGPRYPGVIVFADGPGAEERWVFVETAPSTHVLGRWDGSEVEACFTRFHRWLVAVLTVADENIRGEAERLDTWLSCDPRNALLLLRKAERLVAAGDPDRALPLLRQATAEDPDLLPAWQRLGDVLIATQRGEAQFAWVKALRAMRLPLAYPGQPAVDPDLLGSLQALFDPDDAAWERELVDLVNERILDLKTKREADFAEAAGLALARLLLSRQDRKDARKVLANFLERSATFRFQADFVEVRLLCARLETELGLHDEAEERLRLLHEHGDPGVRSRARLALGGIVVARQEPWAEEILEEAVWDLKNQDNLAEALLLVAERHLRQNRTREAESALNRAGALIRSVGGSALRALLAFHEGNLLKALGQPGPAKARYAEAESLAVEAHDSEMCLRLAVRAGDMAEEEGNADAAHAAWSHAAEGFAELGLPVREAWAHYRLGCHGDRDAMNRARQLFKTTDLGAGVAAINDKVGISEDDLRWHIERATEYARLRAEAQRARPGRTRADADRPERRLGGHQLAIAACGDDVVASLEQVLVKAARPLEHSAPHPADANLAAYTAAVDLIGNHRSEAGARVLLDHLRHGYLSGPPGRALKAALTRTPNMALVDGMLRIVEHGVETPVTVSRCAEILGWRRELKAVEVLRRLVAGERPKQVRRAAISALGRIGCLEAIDDILPCLDDVELCEAAAIALLLLGDRRGVNFHAQVLTRGDQTRGGSPGEIVGRYGDPSFLLLLLSTAESDEASSFGAMQGLGYLGDPRAVQRLIGLCGRKEARTIDVASGALEILTGHHEDVSEVHLKTRWERFWETAQTHFPAGSRYRFGQILDPGLLIDKLADDDLAARATAYDELVITTGQRLPFDADGAWRVQVHHREEWARWWTTQRSCFPSGRWTFHGRVTG